jgi:uncharacterized protein YqeY
MPGDNAMSEATIRQRLDEDLKTAMRSGDAATRDAIRYILSAVKNAEIDVRGSGKEADPDAALRKLGKQLNDSIEQFRAANREDLAGREEAQLLVLKRYLPEELSDEELFAVVHDAIGEARATGPSDMSRVMPVAMAKAAGRADGKRIHAAVRNALGS